MVNGMYSLLFRTWRWVAAPLLPYRSSAMGRRVGLGVGLSGEAAPSGADQPSRPADLPSCPAVARSLPRRVLRTRCGALALLLLLLALILGLEELYESAQPPECECDSHECFLRHKQDALRGAVSRARHK
jgi:hypothetical protein